MRSAALCQISSTDWPLLLPTHHPPWPDYRYSLSDFLRVLNVWTPNEGQKPGKQHTYTHAGYVLLQLALEHRFETPIAQLMEQRLFKPLGLSSTSIPKRSTDGRARLAPEFMRRAVQGYSSDGDAIETPGDQQGYFDFPGTGQMFSSARDLAVLLAAELAYASVSSATNPAVSSASPMSLAVPFRDSRPYQLPELSSGVQKIAILAPLTPYWKMKLSLEQSANGSTQGTGSAAA